MTNTMHNITIDARYDVDFLKSLCPYPPVPFGSGPSTEPGLQVIYFDPSFSDMMTDAINRYDEAYLAKRKAELTAAVNVKRDALIEGGFDFMVGDDVYTIQSAQSDRENVIGLAVAAMGSISMGAEPGNYEWLVPGQPFGFIAADNRVFPLDAQGMMALYQRGLAFKLGATLYARFLKDSILEATDLATLEAFDIEVGWPE